MTPESALTLYDHLDLLTLLESDNDEGALQLEIEIRDQIQSAAHDKVESIFRLLNSLDATDRAINEEQRRLSDRAKQVDNIRQRVRRAVTYAMGSHGIKAIQGRTCTLSLRNSPPAVVITDEALIPPAYIVTKVETRPDKAAIKKALLAGEEIPGADVTYGDKYLHVK